MSQPSGGSQQPNPVLQYYQKWSEKTPFVTRSISIGIVVFYLLSFFVSTNIYFSNTPFFTVFHYEVYRILLSPIVGNSILTIILIFLTFPTMGLKMESSMGSSSFLFLISMISILTNTLFTIIVVLLYFLGTAESLFWDCSDFWVILFGLITIECLQVPDAPRRMLFIPVDIPSKYMPLILYGMFSLFGGFQLSYAISIFIGFLSVKGYLDRLKPSSHYFEELEANTGCFHSISRQRGWVLAGIGLGHDSWIPLNMQEATWGEQKQETGTGSSDSSLTNNTTHKPKDMFPGSGRTLTPSAGSGWVNFPSGSSSTSTGVPSREEIAARRLAAIEGSTNDSKA